MKKILLGFILIYTFIVSNKTLAKEEIYKQNWLEVPKKVRIYKSYNLRRRRGYLQPGKYKFVAIGANYYQLDDSTYIKKSPKIKIFKVIYKPEGIVTIEDTIQQHREHVKAMIAEKTRISPLTIIFMILTIIVMIIAFILN